MIKDFLEKYNEEGMVLLEELLSADLVETLKYELKNAIKKENEYHGSQEYKDYGMVLCCAKYGGNFLKIFENENVFKPFELVLGKDCILYSNASSAMPPKKSNFSRRVHIDVPIDFPNDFPLRMLSLILLDDFTNENGGTWFLPQSHRIEEKPDDSVFYTKSKRLNAKAGSVLYWNPKIWHAGGDNSTDKWRDAFTIVMTRPFCKQRIDMPKMLGEINLNHKAKRRLGYLNIPPISYEDYYARK